MFCFAFALAELSKNTKTLSNTALDKNEHYTTTPSSSNSLNSRFPHEKMCLPDTCSNNGICYDSFVDDSSHAASSGDYYLQWMISPSEPFCDCDLTSYTGSTCSDGNQTFNQHCGFIINKYLPLLYCSVLVSSISGESPFLLLFQNLLHMNGATVDQG